jgi:hypothetical protein
MVSIYFFSIFNYVIVINKHLRFVAGRKYLGYVIAGKRVESIWVTLLPATIMDFTMLPKLS